MGLGHFDGRPAAFHPPGMPPLSSLLQRLSSLLEPAAAGDFGKIFDTYWFAVFATVVLTVYWLLARPALRRPFLAVASLVFEYHFAGPAGMLPILVLGLLTYLLGLTRRPPACALGIVVTVAALCFFKYAHFLAGEVLGRVNGAWGVAADASATHWLPAAPPLAISFFAFEFIHYLYEVRRGGEPIRHPLRFLLFATFFPSLVAGPIKRYRQFIPALETGVREVGATDVAAGLQRVAVGFFKKVVIADSLVLALDFYTPLAKFATLTLPERWLIFLIIALRILADFSGYSDIAIGLARMLGIRLPENFNWPYVAVSVQDFWQRWHMSLSLWIRDYVYIPLGGNRRGVPRQILNGLIAFAVIGLWHGAAWHFVLWGLWHGAGLAVCSSYAALPIVGGGLARWLPSRPAVGWLLTQLFVGFGWLIFFFPVDQAARMAALLFGSPP
jgi:alginate O-acetyltransferase complex protein AlgI